MRKIISLLLMLLLIPLTAASALAQNKTLIPDLKALSKGVGGIIPVDARVTWIDDLKGKPAIRIQSKKDDTVIILNGIEFNNGVIEFDALGQSNPPQSNFLGIAFRFVDEATHDAVYFRPFNFRAEQSELKSHAMQYISHPKYSWSLLRAEMPGHYEAPIIPPPDGDAWFHVRIVVQKPQVSVFVEDAKKPSLLIEELSNRKGGRIGLWIGPGDGGSFANLKITPSI